MIRVHWADELTYSTTTQQQRSGTCLLYLFPCLFQTKIKDTHWMSQTDSQKWTLLGSQHCFLIQIRFAESDDRCLMWSRHRINRRWLLHYKIDFTCHHFERIAPFSGSCQYAAWPATHSITSFSHFSSAIKGQVPAVHGRVGFAWRIALRLALKCRQYESRGQTFAAPGIIDSSTKTYCLGIPQTYPSQVSKQVCTGNPLVIMSSLCPTSDESHK